MSGSDIKTSAVIDSRKVNTIWNNAVSTEVFSSDVDPSTPLVIGKHPVLMLNEIRPQAEYVPIDDESGAHKCKVTVDGQTFEGAGSNKKLAKAKAAEAAMTSLFGLTFCHLRGKNF